MKRITNKEFKEDKFFISCCEKVGITPTMRQASKFRNEKGSAYKSRRLVKEMETVPYIPALRS